MRASLVAFFFFFNDTATTEIYTLSLHDALPIWIVLSMSDSSPQPTRIWHARYKRRRLDRKSTRLNSSHQIISYAVFCLKKKKKQNQSCVSLTHLLTLPVHQAQTSPLPVTPAYLL